MISPFWLYIILKGKILNKNSILENMQTCVTDKFFPISTSEKCQAKQKNQFFNFRLEENLVQIGKVLCLKVADILKQGDRSAKTTTMRLPFHVHFQVCSVELRLLKVRLDLKPEILFSERLGDFSFNQRIARISQV